MRSFYLLVAWAVGSTAISTGDAEDSMAMEVTWQGLSKAQQTKSHGSHITRYQVHNLTIGKLQLTESQTEELVSGIMRDILTTLPRFLDPAQRNITGGVLDLSVALFKTFDKVIQETEFAGTQEYQYFETSFTQALLNSTTATEMVDVTAKLENNELEAIAQLISTLLEVAKPFVVNLIKDDIARDTITKLFDSVIVAGTAFTQCWDKFEANDPVAGTEAMYIALRQISKFWLPKEVQNNVVFRNIMYGVDHIMGNLTTHVRLFEERLINNSICVKGTQQYKQISTTPSKCPNDAPFLQSQFCFKVLRCDCTTFAAADTSLCVGESKGQRFQCKKQQSQSACEQLEWENIAYAGKCKWRPNLPAASLVDVDADLIMRKQNTSNKNADLVLFEKALISKGPRPTPRPTPWPTPRPTFPPPMAAVKARCEDDSVTEPCYTPCAREYKQMPHNYCAPQCPVKYPNEGKIGITSILGCGMTAGCLQKSFANQVNKIVDTAQKAITFGILAFTDGDKIEKSHVTGLIDSCMALAREFVYPKCKYEFNPW
jgi:predicted XRE-type DNA-binding protein